MQTTTNPRPTEFTETPQVLRTNTLPNAFRHRAKQAAPAIIRWGIALIFVWFGALKVAGMSPVEPLLRETLPWIPLQPLMIGLGLIEVILGVALAARRQGLLVPVIILGHLAGTFLSVVSAPGRIFMDGNLALITTEGEFVAKNIVLIGAVLALIALERDEAEPTS